MLGFCFGWHLASRRTLTCSKCPMLVLSAWTVDGVQRFRELKGGNNRQQKEYKKGMG